MKLFDPFAGIKLANGHALFHLAFFIGSFVVNVFQNPKLWYAGTEEEFDIWAKNTDRYNSM